MLSAPTQSLEMERRKEKKLSLTLMDLPAEIRLLIFYHLYKSAVINPSNSWPRPFQHEPAALSILRVSRQCRAEALVHAARGFYIFSTTNQFLRALLLLTPDQRASRFRRVAVGHAGPIILYDEEEEVDMKSEKITNNQNVPGYQGPSAYQKRPSNERVGDDWPPTYRPASEYHFDEALHMLKGLNLHQLVIGDGISSIFNRDCPDTGLDMYELVERLLLDCEGWRQLVFFSRNTRIFSYSSVWYNSIEGFRYYLKQPNNWRETLGTGQDPSWPSYKCRDDWKGTSVDVYCRQHEHSFGEQGWQLETYDASMPGVTGFGDDDVKPATQRWRPTTWEGRGGSFDDTNELNVDFENASMLIIAERPGDADCRQTGTQLAPRISSLLEQHGSNWAKIMRSPEYVHLHKIYRHVFETEADSSG